MNPATKILITFFLLFLSSCTYLKYSLIQAEYSKIQESEPSQTNLKHMLDRESFFVIGKSIDKADSYRDITMAIAAYSDKFKQNERVDTMIFKGAGRHYGLTLPAGEYRLIVYADIDNDQVLHPSEVVGVRRVTLDLNSYPEKVAKNIDVELSKPSLQKSAELIEVSSFIERPQSIYYPEGSIRDLDDPIFDEKVATMGMYDPASFLEYAPTMFYALEEDTVHKIPVVFVHGIGGSSRSFKPIIDQLDRERYRIWFFYYPSGGDLDQFADFFYNLFLSGDVIPLNEMPMIVVAHSMGGLVVREAFNKYHGDEKENKVELFISIASPFAGHPSAANGEENGLIVLPAWRDLNPESQFINQLYRKPLPNFINHQLFYAYRNSDTLKFTENSDGVVPLSSQLRAEAQAQSQNQFGFNNGHVDILESNEMINQLTTKMRSVNSVFPESHMKLLAHSGLDIELSDNYSPVTKNLIRYAGKYVVLLINDAIEPFHPDQRRFIDAVQGKTRATSRLEKDFILFSKEYSDLISDILNQSR